MWAQLGMRRHEGAETRLCVCSMSERSGAAENKSAPSLTYTQLHTHIIQLNDRPGDLARGSLLCFLATRLSPTVQATHNGMFSLTDDIDSQSEQIPPPKKDACNEPFGQQQANSFTSTRGQPGNSSILDEYQDTCR